MRDYFKKKNRNDIWYLLDEGNLQYEGRKSLDHGHPPRGFANSRPYFLLPDL
jgi:hypothetical protein